MIYIIKVKSVMKNNNFLILVFTINLSHKSFFKSLFQNESFYDPNVIKYCYNEFKNKNNN